MHPDERKRVEELLRTRQPITPEERFAIEDEYATELNGGVYKAALVYERAEGLGLLHGNGHHMAQEIAMEAEKRLRDRFKRERTAASGTFEG